LVTYGNLEVGGLQAGEVGVNRREVGVRIVSLFAAITGTLTVLGYTLQAFFT
jgi:hypothetical protein